MTAQSRARDKCPKLIELLADAQRERKVSSAAAAAASALFAEGKELYTPVDKLALSHSPESVLNALYELTRIVAAENKINDDLRQVIEAIKDGAEAYKAHGESACLESALILAHALATNILAHKPKSQGR